MTDGVDFFGAQPHLSCCEVDRFTLVDRSTTARFSGSAACVRTRTRWSFLEREHDLKSTAWAQGWAVMGFRIVRAILQLWARDLVGTASGGGSQALSG